MDSVLGKVLEQSRCEENVGNARVTAFVFADNSLLVTVSLEVLVMALEALPEITNALGLEVFWAKTKLQVFEGLLGETVLV